MEMPTTAGDNARVTSGATGLAARVAAVRARTLALVAGLDVEDLTVQSMPDASPAKWHLAHTTWFFETLVLAPHFGLAPLRPAWQVLFNSYYEALGERHPRPQRGLLTRPTLAEVLAWRHEVDARLAHVLARGTPEGEALAILELGLQHEQQHQELLVTDLKHLFAHNPLRPAWHDGPLPASQAAPLAWIAHEHEGPLRIGAGEQGFAFDNERPTHTVWLRPFVLASRPVSNAEYREFIAAGGYRDPAWWLSDGWAAVQANGWQGPLYWLPLDAGEWREFTVAGVLPVDPEAPVAHLSHFEADAYARWAGARLPSESEWEAVAVARGWFDAARDDRVPHPAALMANDGVGQVWEWTGSAYLPYPGFVPLAGVAGEYNGKFMSGQMVLRGASCATPPGHARRTYRNFFPPSARWQFSGIRLAKDLR